MNSENRMKIVKIISLAVFTAGIAVIIGWIFDINILKSIFPSWISMKISTALAFVLSGISLYYIAEALGGEFDIAQVVLSLTSLVIILLMGILFFSTTLGVHTGIEDLFIKDTGNLVKSVIPGRPSVPTMVEFLLITSCNILTILNPGKLQQKLKVIGFIILIIGALAVTGYIVNAPLLYYYIKNLNSAMACHTALLFVLLGTGLICLSD